MSLLEAALFRLGHDLDALGNPWALVGALAVAAHAEARATLDVDVAVAVEGPARRGSVTCAGAVTFGRQISAVL